MSDPRVTHIVRADIKNFYGAIDQDFAVEATPLPRKVAKAVLLAKSYSYCLGNPEEENVLSGDPYDSTIASGLGFGIPQGSACSSILAALLISDLRDLVEEAVDSHVRLITYEDDIAMLCHSRDEAERLERALTDVLTTHPAGPFRLGPGGGIKEVGERTYFLGAHFTRNQSGCVDVDPAATKYDKLTAYIDVIAREDFSDVGGVDKLRSRLNGLRAAYRDCSDYVSEADALIAMVPS